MKVLCSTTIYEYYPFLRSTWYTVGCAITLTSQWPRWRLKSPASRLFTQPFIQTQIKENIKAPRHWPLCGEFTGTGEFPAQRASNAENVSIWWRQHATSPLRWIHLCHLQTGQNNNIRIQMTFIYSKNNKDPWGTLQLTRSLTDLTELYATQWNIFDTMYVWGVLWFDDGRNKRKYIILHIDEHQIHFVPSRSLGETFFVKMYSSQICQYPDLVVKGLIKCPYIKLN